MKKTEKSNTNEIIEIPAEEAPYALPDGWKWVRFGDFSTNQYGYSAKAVDDDKLPKMLRITDIQDNGVDWKTVPGCKIEDSKLDQYRLVDNDIVIARIGATTGKSFLINKPPLNAVFASYLIRVRFSKDFLPKYVYCFLQSETYWKQISDLSSGIALPGVNSTKLQTMMFPFPPLETQKRIVDRIESLFAKLDEAKEKAQTALDTFELRKSAILHKAFTGELTAQWREEHGIGLDSWEHKRFSDLCDIVRGGSPRPAGSPEFYDGNIPFMKVADITQNNSPYVSSTEHTIKEAGLKKTRMVEPNTLLLTNSGATLGVPAITTIRTTFNDGIAAFLNLDADNLMFYYYFWTSKTSELRGINKGAAQPNLNTNIIGAVEIDIPTKDEQARIINALENLLAKENAAKEAAEAVIEKIDLMKKSILARAFRGEL